jgi:hypothetical protein
MNTKIIAGAVAIAALAAVLAAGCSNPPTHGYVYSINYNPPSSIWWPGHWYSECSGSGSSRHCWEEYQPGWTEYIPESWQIELCAKPGAPSKSNACGWRDVDSQTYHSVRLGQFWSAVAGVFPSST